MTDLKSQAGRLEQALEEFVLAFPGSLYSLRSKKCLPSLGEVNGIGQLHNIGPAEGPIEY